MDRNPRTEYIPLPAWGWVLLGIWSILSVIHRFRIAQQDGLVVFANPIGILGATLIILTYGHYRVFSNSYGIRIITIVCLLTGIVLFTIALL
jgi:hypothetical protein